MYFKYLTTNSRKSSKLYTAGLARLWPCLIAILLGDSAVFDTDSASSPIGHKTLLGEGGGECCGRRAPWRPACTDREGHLAY